MGLPVIKPQSFSRDRHLAEADIDLWTVDLDYGPACLASHYNMLSDVEKERANRFVFPKDRNHFIVCRGTLRKILGRDLGIAPERVNISSGRYGKPFIAGGDSGLRFNVSHSRGIATVAVSRNREVGVDIEFVNGNFDVFSVATAVFSTVGIARLRALPLKLRASAFFAGWTRKEAFLKAIGDGLSSSNSTQSTVLSVNDEDLTSEASVVIESRRWSLTPLKIREDFMAALVVEGGAGTIRMCHLDPNC